MHAAVIVSHFREYVLFGVFFAVIAPLQIAWAELVRRAPDERRLLAVGAVGNAAIVAVWLASRTVGLPIGPERLQAEAVRVTDVMATSAEILVVAIVACLLSVRGPRPAPSWIVPVSWTVAAGCLLAALAGGGH